VTAIEIEDGLQQPAKVLMSGRDYCMRIRYRRGFGAQPIDGVFASLELADARGNTVGLVSSDFSASVRARQLANRHH
jgi:hypothetical protein